MGGAPWGNRIPTQEPVGRPQSSPTRKHPTRPTAYAMASAGAATSSILGMGRFLRFISQMTRTAARKKPPYQTSPPRPKTKDNPSSMKRGQLRKT